MSMPILFCTGRLFALLRVPYVCFVDDATAVIGGGAGVAVTVVILVVIERVVYV